MSRAPRTSRPFAATLAVIAVLAVAALAVEELAPAPTTLAVLVAVLVGAGAAWNLGVVRVPTSAPSTLYFAALAAFHLGLVVPWVAGLVDAPPWLTALPDRVLGRALLLVVLAFTCLETGLLMGWGCLGDGARRPAGARFRHASAGTAAGSAPRPASRRLRSPRPARSAGSLQPAAQTLRTPSALHSGGLWVAFGAGVAAVLNLWAVGVERFLSASYGYEVFATSDSRFLQTGLFWLLPAGVLLALAGARAGIETTRTLALAATVALLLLWAGDRGGAISFAAAALVVWTYTRGALPRRVVLAGAAAVLLLVPAVAALRQLPRNGVDVRSIGEAVAGSSPLAALTEMGWSLRPLVETVRLVPSEFPHRHGGSYLAATARVIPNLGLATVQQDWSDPAVLPPNHWITYTVAPWTYASFGGLGYSAVAEPYLNFGPAGVMGYFLSLGVVLGRTDRRLARARSRRAVALAALVFMPLLLTVRNDFHGFVRPALWGVALVLVVERVYGVRRPNTHGSRRTATSVPARAVARAAGHPSRPLAASRPAPARARVAGRGDGAGAEEARA